jgi:hypothetical protein
MTTNIADHDHAGEPHAHDGGVSPLATMSGDVAGGYTAALTIGL